MSRRAVLWVAFAVVHLGVAWLGFHTPNEPMGDVYNVYEPWSTQALDGRGIVGITEPWVYPQLALVPMVLAHAFAWIAGYTAGWPVLVTIGNALGFALLVGRGRSTGRTVAAWFWLAFVALLGPIAIYRIDGVTVPLALAGLLWIASRPWLGSALLTIGAWVKVWPAALVAAGVIALRRRRAVVGSAAILTGAVLGVIALAGGASNALGFVAQQTDRGLQLEAPVGMLYLWRASAGIEGSFVFYSPELLTYQVAGPNVDTVIAVMTPLLALVVLAIAGLGAYKAFRRAGFAVLFPPLALSVVLALIVFNKVGSPQFATWLIAPLVFWLAVDRARAWPLAVTGLAIAGLTQAVYPLAYAGLLTAQPFAVALLSARNALLVVLLAWATVLLARVRTPQRRSAPTRTAPRAA